MDTHSTHLPPRHRHTKGINLLNTLPANTQHAHTEYMFICTTHRECTIHTQNTHPPTHKEAHSHTWHMTCILLCNPHRAVLYKVASLLRHTGLFVQIADRARLWALTVSQGQILPEGVEGYLFWRESLPLCFWPAHPSERIWRLTSALHGLLGPCSSSSSDNPVLSVSPWLLTSW